MPVAPAKPAPGTGRILGSPGIGLPLKMPQWLTGSGAPSGLNEPKSAASWHVLKQRRFLLYFGGSFVSNMGTWLQNTAQMLLAYQITHSAFAVGLVTCAQFSGFLVLGPWAAKLADILGAACGYWFARCSCRQASRA
jgi:hypothetical protein